MAMTQFEPNYENLVKAARNIEVKRIPLYEHYVSPKVMETLRGTTFEDCYHGDDRDLDNYFHHYCGFYRDMGSGDPEQVHGQLSPVGCRMEIDTQDSYQ